MLFRILMALAILVNFSLAASRIVAGTLAVPDELTLLFLNGEKVPSSFFRHTNRIDITAGPNNIIVKYDDIISGDISDDHTVFESLPFALNFVAEPDFDYQVNMALPRNEDEAKKFESKPIVTLSNSENMLVPLEIEYQKSEQEEKLAELFRPLTGSGASPKIRSRIEVPSEPIHPEKALKSPSSIQKDTVKNMKPALKLAKGHEVMQPQALTMLKYWWQQASAAQRLDFRNSVERE
ncbi:MAG: hypothetical protein ACI92E_003205 [Oceanicoccus sp.]|jgi:uncharacterized protein YccT (UPF0319 family)